MPAWRNFDRKKKTKPSNSSIDAFNRVMTGHWEAGGPGPALGSLMIGDIVIPNPINTRTDVLELGQEYEVVRRQSGDTVNVGLFTNDWYDWRFLLVRRPGDPNLGG